MTAIAGAALAGMGWQRSSAMIDDAQARTLYAYLHLVAAAEKLEPHIVRGELELFVGGTPIEALRREDFEAAFAWLDRRAKIGLGRAKFSAAPAVVGAVACAGIPCT